MTPPRPPTQPFGALDLLHLVAATGGAVAVFLGIICVILGYWTTALLAIGAFVFSLPSQVRFWRQP